MRGMHGALTQVTVKRDNHEDVWWIDSRLAVVGKRVRDEDCRVWAIAEVHGERDRAFLDAQENARGQLAYVLGASDHNPVRDPFWWDGGLRADGLYTWWSGP